MAGLVNGRAGKSGLPPGTLIHIGERKSDKTLITVFDYNENHLDEESSQVFDEKLLKDVKHGVRWVNIDGVHEAGLLEKVGNAFGLHPLVMEDILNTSQRPKFEDYGDYIYIVARMIYHLERHNEVYTEQVSLILGKGFVLSFQEKKGDVFNPVRERLRNGTGRLRKSCADYLAYALLDVIVDNYFNVLEKLGEKIEAAEEALVMRPGSGTLQVIHNLKRAMLFLHKAIWPLREVMSSLEHDELDLIHDSTRIYLRDIYDHIIQIMETTETYRDILSSMLDIYLSSISNRMNEIMKVLTIISTLFIPLTFLAGLYGMNFKNMPELEWPWSYPVLLGVMAAIVGVMLYYFKKKKWI